MSVTWVDTWHFWVTLETRQWHQELKKSRNRGKKGSSPFVPVTPFMLIFPHCPGLCGKPISSHTCLLETDGWFYWGVIDVFFFSWYLCVCVQCICNLLSLFDGLIWVPLCHQRGLCSESLHWQKLPCVWSETICSRQAYPKRTTAAKGVARSKRSLRASIDFHIWEHLYYCWSPNRAQQAAQGPGLPGAAGAVGSVTHCLHCGPGVMLFD